MKNILFGSVVAAALILSGCGSSSKTTASGGDKNDTTAPVVNTTVTGKKGDTVTVATDNTAVTKLTVISSDINVTNNNNGKVVIDSAEGTYSMKVVAEDAAGNKSPETDVAITVKAAGTTTPPAGTVTIGNLVFTPLIAQNDDDRNASGKQNQDKAREICSAKGLALPTESQIDNITNDLLDSTAFVNGVAFSEDNRTTPVKKYLPIWVENNGRYYHLNVSDRNDSHGSDADAIDENYYTCVKQK